MIRILIVVFLALNIDAVCVDCPNSLFVESSLAFAQSQTCGALQRLVLMRLTIVSRDRPFQLIVQGSKDGSIPDPGSHNLVPPDLRQPLMSIKLNGLGVADMNTFMQATLTCSNCNLLYGIDWACLSTSTDSWIPQSWSDTCYPYNDECFSVRSLTCISNAGLVENNSYCNSLVPPTTRFTCLCNIWRTGDWSNCNNCSQSRIVSCVNSDGNTVLDSLCTNTRPPTLQTCTWNCPSNWVLGPWSTCVACVESRLVECVDLLGNVVMSSKCSGSRPPALQSCSSGCRVGSYCTCSCTGAFAVTDCDECNTLCNNQCPSNSQLTCVGATQSNSSDHTREYTIIGVCIGVLIIFIGCLIWHRRRKTQKQQQEELNADYVAMRDQGMFFNKT